ncbi:MAG: CBS domain-containing protein [Erysipelotrichaceae bacterium]|jgi:predicted transcriptional regulator
MDKVEQSIVFLLTPKSKIVTLNEDYTIRQCLEKMKHYGYSAMPVLNHKGEYVATVSEGDFLWHLLQKGEYNIETQEDYTLKDIIRITWNKPIHIYAKLEEVLTQVMDQNFVPVIDDRGMFMGIITRKSVMQYYSKKYLESPTA